jgi:protein TonB
MSPALRPETAFTRPPSRRGVAGWLGSASVAALLMSGLAALAMSVSPSGESMADEEAPMMLTLPPAAPNLAALSDTAPETAPDAPEATEVPEPEAQPDLPDVTEAVPDVPDPAIRPPDPMAEDVPVADEVPPPPPQPAELAVAETQPEPEKMAESPKPVARPKKPEQKFVRNPPEKPVEKAKEKPVEKKAEKKTAQADKETSKASAAASPTKQSAGEVSTGQGQSAAKNYGASVKKKILKTRKKTPSGKGTVKVSFSIAGDGGLVSVKVMNSSGSAEVDKTAINHIQRAAPFAPPPPGAETNYSWEFIYN